MEAERKLKTLQMFYSAALADSVLRMGREGVLDRVREAKRTEQLAGGKARAAQMGLEQPSQVFTVLSDIFGCADWAVAESEGGFRAEAKNCMLCGMAKRVGAESPCRMYCLDPMEGMVKGLAPGSTYTVVSTLWDGEGCVVDVETAG